MDCPAAIDIRNALKVHGRGDTRFALQVPRLQVREGEVCVVAGRSGCGKTTLLDILGCMSSFDRCDGYELRAGGRSYNLAHAGSAAKAGIRRRHMGYILQQGGLLPFLSAWENIMLPLKVAGCTALAGQAMELAAALGLRDHLRKYPAALSIGQRQRVDIVRALAARPAILLADEPTGALDPITAKTVREQLLHVVRRLGTTLVLVSHDWQLFREAGDRFFSFDVAGSNAAVVSTLVETGSI